MEPFNEFLSNITEGTHRENLRILLTWIGSTYKELEPSIRWNQPMFTHHGTYIIGFSVSKNHFSIAPERKAIIEFSKAIQHAGYSYTKNLFRIGWGETINYPLLERIINFNIEDKASCTTFWRKEK